MNSRLKTKSHHTQLQARTGETGKPVNGYTVAANKPFQQPFVLGVMANLFAVRLPHGFPVILNSFFEQTHNSLDST